MKDFSRINDPCKTGASVYALKVSIKGLKASQSLLAKFGLFLIFSFWSVPVLKFF